MSLREFEEYGNLHRMFLQAMMSRKIIANEAFKPLVALCCKRCNVTIPEGKEPEALGIFLRSINKKIKKLSLRVGKILDEEEYNKQSYLVLLNECDRSKESTQLTIKTMVSFAPHELEYLKIIVHELLENPMRELSPRDAVNRCVDINKSLVEAEAILDKLCQHQWLRWIDDEKKTGRKLRLAPRFIYEMQPYLKEVYPNLVANCCQCNKIVVRSIDCPQCSAKYHMYCLPRNYKCETDLCKATLPKTRQPARQEVEESPKRKKKRRIQESESETDPNSDSDE